MYGLGLRNVTLAPPEPRGWQRLAFCSKGIALVRTAGRTTAISGAVGIVLDSGATLCVKAYADLRILYLRDAVYGATALRLTPLLLALVERFVEHGYLDPAIESEARLLAVITDELAAALPQAPLSLALPRDPRARAAADLWNDAAEAPTLAQTARVLGISGRTLDRLFLRETGMSAGRWRRRMILMCALAALARGDTVARAALDAGYSAASAFIHAFRREFGVTPSRWVKA